MAGSIERNRVVKYFGTPDLTEGTVNEPRERIEYGLKFNEKWIYKHPMRDPAHAAERMLLWRRYDFVASLIRKSKDGEWEPDESLAGVLS
jgi:hypothetical protein